MNVTLLGKRVFEDVIKLRVGPYSNMTAVLIERGEYHVRTEAHREKPMCEIGAIQLQVKGSQGLIATTRIKGKPRKGSTESQRKHDPIDTSILDF